MQTPIDHNPTIAAISTPFGTGGLGIIRISGTNAVKIADSVFFAADKKPLSSAQTHTIHYGHIKDSTGNTIDEVMAAVMLAPRTFTAEDVVEISTHGSPVAMRRVLEYILQNGATLAAPGEFTQRAFEHGRIDLSQAEAIIDIINAASSVALSDAVGRLEGSLSQEIEHIRQPLLYICAQFAALVDYPDEDIADLSVDSLSLALHTAIGQCERLINTADSGRIAKEGLRCAIVGKPNVGKSSLLNALAKAERAIVTEIAGTTRDIIEEYITISGVPLRLIDTAGIRETSDVVENMGVERSVAYAHESDLVLVMLDGSKPLDQQDTAVLDMTSNKRRIILVNKSDLPDNIGGTLSQALPRSEEVLHICAKSGDGLNLLGDAIVSICNIQTASQSVMLSNIRHINALRDAHQGLVSAQDTLLSGMPIDMCAIDISAALGKLGEITGIQVSADIIDTVFAQFCVGK